VSQFLRKNIVEQASTPGSLGAFFIQKQQQKLAGDSLKWQVTAANVKMCDNIARKVKCTCPLHQPILSQIF